MLALAQQHQGAVHQVGQLLRFLVALLRLLLDIDDALFERIQIGQHQLRLDRVDIRDRVDLAVHMGDVAILEAAHHMGNRIDFADIGEELVAEPLPLGSAAHQPRNVNEGERVGMIWPLPAIFASTSSRGSGTATSPTLGSMVQNG